MEFEPSDLFVVFQWTQILGDKKEGELYSCEIPLLLCEHHLWYFH